MGTMRRLKATVTPLTHLSYQGSLPRARVETGFFRQTARVSRFTEEQYRIPVAEQGEVARQLCVRGNDQTVHVLVQSNRTYGVASYFKPRERDAQEQKLWLNLGESLPGGGASTQLNLLGAKLALFLPGWDTVFLFDPFGGRCDTIRLGKGASAFSPRRTKAQEATMFSTRDQTQLVFCAMNSLRAIEDDELITVELLSDEACTIRPFGHDEFIVQNAASQGHDNSLGIIQRLGKLDWQWMPIQVQKSKGTQDENRQWSTEKVAWSKSSYFQTVRPVQENDALSRQWEIVESPRVAHQKGFDKWAFSKSLLACVSTDSKIMEVVDLETNLVRTLPITPSSGNSKSSLAVETLATDNNGFVYLVTREDNEASLLRVFDVKQSTLERDLGEWRKMWGLPDPNKPRWGMQGSMRGESKESTSPPEAKNPKHGKVDDEFHAGGNTFAGGTGGSDTAGLGGRGGPYRLDKGHKIHQISDELKQQVDEEVLKKARELGKLAWEERLKEIRMDPRAYEAYSEARSRVEGDLERLKAVLEAAATITKERMWERNQSYGELDDSRLVDGLVGEKLIYKRRVKREPPPGSPSSLLNVRIVVDMSASMYRFQSLDGRLQRMIDTTLMLLEAIGGLEHRFRVSLAGHSGESPNVPLVEWDQSLRNEGDIYRVLETMAAHSQYCVSGDYTVEAVYSAVEDILDQDSENGGLVCVVSDANLRRYGVAPSELAKAMDVSPLVKTFVVFIASVRDEAEELVRELPFGRAKVCLETSDLPHVMRDILAEASTQSPS